MLRATLVRRDSAGRAGLRDLRRLAQKTDHGSRERSPSRSQRSKTAASGSRCSVAIGVAGDDAYADERAIVPRWMPNCSAASRRTGGPHEWIHAVAIAACSGGKQATKPSLHIHRHAWPRLTIARSFLPAHWGTRRRPRFATIAITWSRYRFYDRDFEVVGWSARKSDHADYLIVSVSTDDAREGRLGVLCGNNELGSATPEVIAGDPAAAGRLDHRRRRCALRHGTLVGPGVRRPPGP